MLSCVKTHARFIAYRFSVTCIGIVVYSGA